MRETLSLYEATPLVHPVSLISIPTDLGSDARGLFKTPDYLRAHGLAQMLEAIGAEVSQGSIACPTAPAQGAGILKNLDEVAEVARQTARVVEEAALKNEIIIALGGDHSSAIGTLAGASRAHPSLGLIWIDAHPDVHTPETTRSHNLHNMPAALAMGEGHEALLGERIALDPQNVLFIGLKDIDAAELDFLLAREPHTYTMLDIAARGLSPIFNGIAELSRRVEKVWISMDMDVIDKEFAPGVAMPNTCGLSRREILSLAHYIGKTCDVAGLDLVEMLPSNDLEGKTAALALELIAKFLGQDHSWYSRYMRNYETAEFVEKRQI